MGEIIRDWLRTRLGVIIDLSPEIFGHYARDGTLLAKVLHSYDVINDSQLSTLLETQDPALARVNLKHLKVWLRFVGVDCDADCIEDISNGKGTMSLRLFYKVFLCLENKDRLHFITLQKEREKYIPSSSKFDVTTISEEPETRDSEDHPGAASLIINRSLVDWERKKSKRLIDGSSKRDGEKFGASREKGKEEEEIEESTSGKKKKIPAKRTGGSLPTVVALKRELDEFARKHRVDKSKESSDPCQDIVKHGSRRSKTPRIDHEAARAYTKSLKSKHHQEALTKSFKTRLQKNLLNDLWKKVLDDQEMEFDEIVARKVLHQSQYEKRLVRKLCDIRSQKTRIAGNRRIVEELVEKTRENEMRLEDERAREVMVRESEEVEAETRRINELERKINEQSRLKREEKVCRFGEKMVHDLVDISIKAGEYKIQSNEDQVPNQLWNQWKALFFKSQPIIVPANYETIVRDDDIGGEEAWLVDEIEKEDETRTQVLNDENFEDYQNMRSPWKDFTPNLDDQVREYLNLGLNVLGYIVHKTLEYPRRRTESVEPPLPVMRTRAVVLGVPDSLLYEPIQELLKNSKIHLVRIEEAINYCLERYKAEMRDVEYIDLGIIAVTGETSSSPSIPLESVERGKKVHKSEKTPSGRQKTAASVQRIELSKNRVDKVTQTPRVIPHEDMDPSLSDAAYIGKWTHEFLTLGEPLSDELNSRIIVEYLKSLEDIRGFVIVNYPNTCRQMNSLEFVLTGRVLPINRYKFLTQVENPNIEDVDSIPSSRIIYDEEENNDSEEDSLRQSRLVPNPVKPRLDGQSSYFTAFVRIKPMESRWRDEKEKDDTWEVISEDATSLDAFYVDQGIASIFYYRIFDLSTLKRLVRLLIIAGTSESISRASSRELFGEYLDYFEGRRDDDYSASKAPMVKKLLRSRASDCSFGESKFSESVETTVGEEVSGARVFDGGWKDGPALPGEAEWSWANLPQPAQLLNSLAKIWQSLETCYVENLKQVFHLRRMIIDAVVPYKDFVTRHMGEFIERPDNKQDFLHDFHRAFNLIDQEIRDDAEVKGELHCRIDDFQTKLWEICDSRRREAENERERIVMDNWTTVELINIANLYIDLLQAEIDRCNDTLQFIQDYYASMFERPFREIRFGVSLKKIPPRASTTGSSVFSTRNGSTRSGAKENEFKQLRGKISISNEPQSPPDIYLLEEETRKLLTDVDRDNFVPSQALCYAEANIKYLEGIVDTLASRVLDNLKKEESNVSNSPHEPRDKSKRGSSRRVSRSSKTERENNNNNNNNNNNKRAQNVILEWRYALMFEINRIRVRLKILNAAARSDIGYLIDGMRGVFLGVEKNLIDRYDREIKSVNEMASSFRFAVEEAKPIQEEMLLDADRFLVRSNVLMFPEKPDIPRSPVKETITPSRFKISQLTRLLDIFRRSAPSGIISERSFVYILEDLIVCDDEKSESSPLLPPRWFELRACDVTKLVYELFGDAEFVDWREFIIYGMEIDMPSADEILDNFRAFRRIDDKSEEHVSRDEFLSTRLWFCDGGNVRRDLSSPATDLAEKFLRDEIYDESCYVTEPRKNSDVAGARDVEPAEQGETLRLELAKKLLCEMFLFNCQRVNYVALFMAFCKDERPEIGLGKALSLAIGGKVCTSWRDGEDYVRQRVEEKRIATEARPNSRNLREDEAIKASEGILNRLLNGVVRSSRGKIQETLPNVSMDVRKDVTYETPNGTEKMDLPEEFIDPANFLEAEKKSWVSGRSERETASAEMTLEGRKNRGLSVTISLPGGENEMKRGVTVYWIDFDVCQSILAATLPIHATQPSILESGKSLWENLQLVYLDLRDETLNDEAGVVLAHRFIHHDFVNKLLADTRKFTSKYLGNILDNVIRGNQ